MDPRRFVYILRSDTDPDRHYVGITGDVARRLHWHNTGPSGVTRNHRPWSLVVSLQFIDARTAGRFERYLKTGSGRAFASPDPASAISIVHAVDRRGNGRSHPRM